MSHILRYYIRPEFAEQQLKDVQDYCHRTGCKELLIFTSSYDFQASFIPLDEYKEYARKIKEWIQPLRADGITININILQTLGHINFPRALSQKFPFQRRVSVEGIEASGGACALDQGIHKYIRNVYQIFAEIKPRLLFVDDDYRASMEGLLCCFCPLHMKKISEKLNRNITREELVDIMLKRKGSQTCDELLAFHESQVESFDSLSGVIQKAVAEISPDTRVGFMAAVAPSGQWGMDFRKIALTLAGPGHKPFIRPQIAFYGERCNIQPYIGGNRQPAIVRNFVGDDVELYPEIENYPYTTYSKSAKITFQQMTMVHLDGCHGHAVNFFDQYGSPMRESEQIIAMLEQYQGFFETLCNVIPEGTRTTGIACWHHADGHLYNRPKLEDVRNLNVTLWPSGYQAEDYISHMGLPLGFDWQNSPFLFLTGNDIAALNREEICALLRRNAVLDIHAVECIIDAGLGEQIGIELGEFISRDQSTVEYFEGADFGTEEMGRNWPLRSYVKDDWCRKITARAGAKLTVLSNVLDVEGLAVCPVVSAVESPNGSRHGILSFAINDIRPEAFVHARRALQMKNLFEWIAGQSLPTIIENHPYVVPQVVPLSNGTTVLGLSNFSLDPCTNTTLKFANGCPQKVRRLTSDGKWLRAESDFEQIDEHRINLRYPIATGDVVVYLLG